MKEKEAMKFFIGLMLKEAEELAATNGFKVRLRQVNGINYVGTANVDFNRINFSVVYGKVTEAYLG